MRDLLKESPNSLLLQLEEESKVVTSLLEELCPIMKEKFKTERQVTRENFVSCYPIFHYLDMHRNKPSNLICIGRT